MNNKFIKIKKNYQLKMRYERKYVIYGIVIAVATAGITGFSILGFSFESVDFNEYALKQNAITRKIEPTIYTEGLYFIGIFNNFITFPSTYVSIEFTPHPLAEDIPISVQTKNGLLVEIDISFQFRLRKADIINIYSDYSTAYKDFVQAEARSALREVAGSYTAEELYTNRSDVNSEMSNALVTSLSSIVDVGNFQLRNIDFPDSFEEAVENYEVHRVEIEIAQLEQEAEMIRQETQKLVTEYTANNTIIEYEGIATALRELATTLNMTNEELLQYIWIETIETHNEAYLFIGLDNPLLIPLNSTSSS